MTLYHIKSGLVYMKNHSTSSDNKH